jgi:DNA polymerase-1
VNIQNIPRKDTVVKASFVPKLDAFLFFDYSQIEYRLFAYYMATMVDDWWAVEQFKAGRDLHTETAKLMLTEIGKPFHDPLEDDERQVGKTGNFAAIYGGGVPTYRRQLLCDASTARRLNDAFHRQYPLLGRGEWRNGRHSDPPPFTLNGQLAAVRRANGFVRTLWGRHLHPEEDRKLLNAVCQGGGADLIKTSMVRIDAGLEEEGCESHMVLSVHDEVGLDCKDDELDFLKQMLPKWMGDTTVEEVLPIEVDMKVSYTNWAEAA